MKMRKLLTFGLILMFYGALITVISYLASRNEAIRLNLYFNSDEDSFVALPYLGSDYPRKASLAGEPIELVGNITVEWPRKLRKGGSQTVLVTLTQLPKDPSLPPSNLSPDRQRMYAPGVAISPPHTLMADKSATISKHWAARLSVTTLEAHTSSPELQPYGVDKAEWRWTITPKEGAEGEQVINLVVETQYQDDPAKPSESGSLKGKTEIAKRGKVIRDEEKEKDKPHAYPIHQSELPVNIELGWVNWTVLKLSGLVALFAGAGMTAPIIFGWASKIINRKQPGRIIGFSK